MMRVWLFIMFFSQCVSAQQAQSISWGAIPSEELATLKKSLNEVRKDDYKEFTEIKTDVSISINKNMVTEKVTKIIYFPDTDAIQNNGIDYIPFNKELDKIKFLAITSINKNGEEKYFSKEDIKVNDSNSYNTFSSVTNAVFSYPGLEKQSFVILAYIITRDIEHREADWSKETSPQTYHPRENYSLNIQWQENMPIQWKSLNTFVTCQESSHALACHGKKIPKALSDDTIFWLDQLNTIQIGQHKNWSETIEHALKKFQHSQVNSSAIEAFTAKLVREKRDMREKITAIQTFVAQDIQYISMSENGNAITPHAISRTLEKRMGDCKDKSALLFSMLTAIGLKPYPTLVATEREKLENLLQPTLNVFDHMIVCFYFEGRKYCIDATNPYSDWRYISPFIQGKVALSLIAEGQPFTLPIAEYNSFVKFKSDYTFLKEGGQSEQQSREYFYEYASRYRSYLSQKNEKEVNDALLDNYKKTVSDKSKPDFTVSRLKEIDKNLLITSEAEFPAFADTHADINYTETDSLLEAELNYYLIPNKIYEYNTKGLKVSSVVTLDISQHWTVKIFPAELELHHKYGTMRRSIRKINSGKIEVNTQLQIPNKLIPSNEIEKFNSFITLLKRESAINIYGALKE